MNLISIKFNDTRSMNITTNCTKNRGNLIKYYRSYHRYKKAYGIGGGGGGSQELNKRANTDSAVSLSGPIDTSSSSGVTGESTLLSSSTSSQVQMRNFNNEMILIKKKKNTKLEPISATERKLNSLETKLNDFIRSQQQKRNTRFSPEKYTDITAKIFVPKFNSEALIRAEKRQKQIEQEQIANKQRFSSFSFTKPLQTAKPKEVVSTAASADQIDNLVVKGLFAVKDNSQLKNNYINTSSSSSVRPKLLPIKTNTPSRPTDTSKKQRVISKSADSTDLHQQYMMGLEPKLNKSQCAYTSAVTSSSHLKSYPFKLINSESSADNNLEFIQNQRQVYVLHRDILNQIHERSVSTMSKYKTRINIEGELNEVMECSRSTILLNEINNSYKCYERVRSKPFKTTKQIKPSSVPANVGLHKPSAGRVILKHHLEKEEYKEENFSDEDDEEEDFDDDYDDLIDDIEENNLK